MKQDSARPVALVTGAARGIGLGVARELAYRGWRTHVVYGGGDPQDLEERFPARVHRADVLAVEDCRRLVREVRDYDERLDAVVHAVGEFEAGPLEGMGREDFERMLTSNATSAFLLVEAARQAIRSSRGSYVFFGCAGLESLRARSEAAAYTAAKQIGMIPCFALTSPQKDKEAFRRDTRCMMMLTMLHDHDLGGWKQRGRDPEVIAQLRKAKNRFVPWDEGVEFLGYWTQPAQASGAAILVSAYRAPGRALFVVGNTGKQAVGAAIRPDWARLGLAPADLRLTDAETGQTLTLDHPRADPGFQAHVSGHDLRLIMAHVRGQ